jgi:hypothetical protein
VSMEEARRGKEKRRGGEEVERCGEPRGEEVRKSTGEVRTKSPRRTSSQSAVCITHSQPDNGRQAHRTERVQGTRAQGQLVRQLCVDGINESTDEVGINHSLTPPSSRSRAPTSRLNVVEQAVPVPLHDAPPGPEAGGVCAPGRN